MNQAYWLFGLGCVCYCLCCVQNNESGVLTVLTWLCLLLSVLRPEQWIRRTDRLDLVVFAVVCVASRTMSQAYWLFWLGCVCCCLCCVQNNESGVLAVLTWLCLLLLCCVQNSEPDFYLLVAFWKRNWWTRTTAGAPSRCWPMTDKGGGASLLPYTPAGVTGMNEWRLAFRPEMTLSKGSVLVIIGLRMWKFWQCVQVSRSLFMVGWGGVGWEANQSTWRKTPTACSKIGVTETYWRWTIFLLHPSEQHPRQPVRKLVSHRPTGGECSFSFDLLKKTPDNMLENWCHVSLLEVNDLSPSPFWRKPLTACSKIDVTETYWRWTISLLRPPEENPQQPIRKLVSQRPTWSERSFSFAHLKKPPAACSKIGVTETYCIRRWTIFLLRPSSSDSPSRNASHSGCKYKKLNLLVQ